MSIQTTNEINIQKPFLFDNEIFKLKLNNGLTTLIGPNGSGKSQVLRHLKNTQKGNIRLLSPGRLSPIEPFKPFHQNPHREYRIATYSDSNYAKSQGNLLETIQADLHVLDRRQDLLIKIQTRLSIFFQRDIKLKWQSGNLSVIFNSTVNGNKYSSECEANGLLHLICMLTAIYNDELDLLMIDEPENSLHPQYQSFLFNEIIKYAGEPNGKGKKKIIIATHSTKMIKLDKLEDLTKLVFFSDIKTLPIQISDEEDILNNTNLQRLIMRLGHDHKEALFCKRPLLVEGISDSIICKALDNKLDLNLNIADSCILPIDGKNEAGNIIKLFHLLKKEPICMLDLDFIADGIPVEFSNNYSNNTKLQTLLAEKGQTTLQSYINTINNNLNTFMNSNWEILKDSAKTQSYYSIINDTSSQDDINKAKKRSITQLLLNDAEEENITTLITNENWKTTKNQLNGLLSTLEAIGCFVLKKGTIESYYCNNSTNNKLELATGEACYIYDETNTENLKNNYNDVIKVLKYASNNKMINEKALLQELLLASITPILAKLEFDSKDEELNLFPYMITQQQENPLLTIKNISRKDGDNEIVEMKVIINSNILEIDPKEFTINKTNNPINIVGQYIQ